MIDAPELPNYFVESVDEHMGKPCVLIRVGGYYYMLTNIDVRDGEVEYDFVVGTPVPGDMLAINWLEDSETEDLENHGMIADLIITDVLQ